MQVFGRWFIRSLATLGFCSHAMAQQTYPTHSVEVVVPYGAGGSIDSMARQFADLATKRSGQPWVVVNRSGAGGLVGFSSIASARADGYVVGFSPASPLTNSPFVVQKMPFEARQLIPVCQVFENTFAIAVHKDSPVKSLTELIELGKRGGGVISYGHAGPASVPHIAVKAIEQASGARFDAIAYRTDGATWNDLFGRTLAFVAQPVTSMPGKPVRVLAVLSDRRHPALPDVPSVKELGYPSHSPGLNGLFMPRGVPSDVLAYVERLCAEVVRSKEFAAAAGSMNQVPAYLPRPAFEARIERTFDANSKIVPSLNLEKN